MEEWKEISVDTRYEVSNMGRVRNKRSGHILSVKPTKSHKHPQVFLMGWAVRLQLTVSHLVYNAFNENDKVSFDRGVGTRIGHHDGNILNNKIENLYRY